MTTSEQALRDRSNPELGSGLNIIAGAWLFVSAFWIPGGPAVFWNDVIVGAFVVVLAAIRFFEVREAAWLGWFNAVAGVWTIVSPWTLALTRGGATTANQVVVGMVITALGLWVGVDVSGAER